MRPLLVTAIAMACTPDAPHLEPWHGDDDGTPYLSDDVFDRFDSVTRLRDDPGEARLRHDGPVLPPNDLWRRPSQLTVVHAGDDLRVVWEGSGVQLLLWLPRVDLVDAVSWTTVGVGVPGAEPDLVGVGQVRVPSGMRVDLDQVEGDHAYVDFDAWSPRSSARVSAWVPLADVDQAWVLDGRSVERTGYGSYLDGPILDRPTGETLAVSATSGPLVVDTTGDSDGGWWPVAWSNGRTRVDGWAYEDDVTPVDGIFGVEGTACTFGAGGIRWLRATSDIVPVDTPLRTDRNGPIVARTTTTHLVPGFDAGGGWLKVDTPWGGAELWADR